MMNSSLSTPPPQETAASLHTRFLSVLPPHPQTPSHHRSMLSFSAGIDEELGSSVVPPVTVVLEGRSICHRVSLQKHASYQSLARALRQMFLDVYVGEPGMSSDAAADLDVSKAVPGHLVAYEDMEDDLLLVGDQRGVVVMAKTCKTKWRF